MEASSADSRKKQILIMKVTFNILMPNKANLSKKHTHKHMIMMMMMTTN